ncbi:MAG: nucleoside deaminase [Vicinamibacteria bacterium]
MDETDVRHLRRAIELARLARAHGNHPFGSLLVGASGEVLAEHENVVVTERDDTGHPELTLVRWAGTHLAPAERAAATVYTSCEHCPMCAAATYWAGIGRIVFALSAAQFAEMLPPDAPRLKMNARELFARGNRRVSVEGPCLELEAEARAVHAGFW